VDITKNELIYWADFFDGEGHIELAYRLSSSHSYLGHGAYQFQVWADQRLDDPDYFFAELVNNFGGRVIPHKKWPGSFRWYIGSKLGRKFLEAILPYLRVQKRLAELGIAFQKSMQETRDNKLINVPKSEIIKRDNILREYFSLYRGTKSKRVLRLGQDYIK